MKETKNLSNIMSLETNSNIPDENQIREYINQQKNNFNKLILYIIYFFIGFSIIFFPLRNETIQHLMSQWWVRIAILSFILYIGLDNNHLLISVGLSILYVLGMNTFLMKDFPLNV